MCGRFSLSTPPEVIAALFQLSGVVQYPLRFNIAPTQLTPVIRAAAGNAQSRHLSLLRWGFVPHWAVDPAIGSKMINSKVETAAEKPAFRDAFRSRRCLVPVDGFYEWQATGKRKQPYRIVRKDGQPLGLAGLWSNWRDKDGRALETFTILTTEPTEAVKSIHNRMPLIIDPAHYSKWLDPQLQDVTELQSLIRSAHPVDLHAYPVSNRVNAPANDDAQCIDPIDPAGGEPEAASQPTGQSSRQAMQSRARMSRHKARKADNQGEWLFPPG
jgi:putative SOS response-associated peptidase YedK